VPVSREEVTRDLDRLIAASQDFEERTSAAGFAQAHDWMFALREVLYDLRRLNLHLADMFNSGGLDKNAPLLLHAVAVEMLYEILPHVQGHLNELEEILTPFCSDEEQIGEN
jgi:hypothetical protein